MKGINASDCQQLYELLTEFSFRLVIAEPSHFRFESDVVYVDVVFDYSQSRELELRFGTVASASQDLPSFTIADLSLLVGGDLNNAIQVGESGDICKWVDNFTEVLRVHGREILEGDSEVFELLEDQRSKNALHYSLSRDLKIARTVAKRAMQSKDYASVVQALAPLKDNLEPTDMAVLRFAEKRCQNRPG